MIISESELRAQWHKAKSNTLTVPRGSVLTPSARDFLRAHGVVVRLEGDGEVDLNRQTMSTAKTLPPEERSVAAGAGREKPEHLTLLRGGRLVAKTHPVIAWRGQLDLFDCALVEAQVTLAQAGEAELAAGLEEVARFAQQIMVAEVREQPLQFGSLLGWTPAELREMSHHPDRYFGIPHTTMSYRDGVAAACLNNLRAKIREVELYAARAFDSSGGCERPDIILALNRLSSLFYILVCKLRGGQTTEQRIPVGVSGRHVHLSPEHLEALFGKGHVLQILKELSQPGQFAAQETVTLAGPKGVIEKVRVLGPVRRATQVEISVTDSFKLGVKPVVRDSGQHEGTAGLRLAGPGGTVEIDRGVMVAARHIHLHPDQAQTWKLSDGQRVRVRIDSERPVVFQAVLLRVSPEFRGELHLDTDEANAALVSGKTEAVIEWGAGR